MKRICLVLFLITILTVQGCSFEKTSELKEKINSCNEKISLMENRKAELKTIDEDIARLEIELAAAKAKWKKYRIKYADEIELLQKEGN